MKETKKYSLKKAITRFYNLVSLEKKEITNIYFYAIVNGIILLSLPLGIQAIINLLFGATISTSLIVLIAIVIIGVLFTGILQIAQMKIAERIQQRIFARLTFAYAYRIPKINLISIDEYYLPELVNRFFDTSNLQKGFSKLLLDFPAASIQILFGLILLCFYHPVFIVFAIIIVTLVFLIFYQTSPKGFNTSMKESDYKYDVGHWLEEVSRAIKTFKFNQQTDLHLDKTDHLVTGYLKSRNDHFSVLLFQYRVMVGFKVMTTAAMLILGSYLFIQQQINLGQFIAAEIIIITILNSIEKMILSLEIIYDVLTSLEKLNNVLDKPQDSERGKMIDYPMPVTAGIDIKINNLNFSYPNGLAVIKGLNLQIKAGEKIAIMGSEGSGKSTLIKLLAGLYHDFTGNIVYNNIPLKMIPDGTLYQRIAVLLADDELFNGTLLENITIGKNDIPFEEIDKICSVVGLQDYIFSQQHGYQTLLDPQGKKLSFNIVQKILLARCLIIKPALLLLEDGWLGIESGIREQVVDFLINKNEGCTMIAITNDDSFAALCNRTLYMESGSMKTL